MHKVKQKKKTKWFEDYRNMEKVLKIMSHKKLGKFQKQNQKILTNEKKRRKE